MKRSSDTFAEFLPRSSIIHLSHALDSSIFHRGHPASIHHTVDDYINPLLLAGYANRSGLILILIQIIHQVNRDNDPPISESYFFFFFDFVFEIFFYSSIFPHSSILLFSVRNDARFDGIWFSINCFLETYLRYRIFCKNISSFWFLQYFVLLFD